MNSKLNLKEMLYKYIPMVGIFTYEVIEIRESKENFLYELECKSCNHGYNCRVLVAKDDIENKFRFVMSTSDIDEEDRNEHILYHKDYDDHYYYLTREEALIKLYHKRERELKEKIQSYNTNLNTLKKNLLDLEIKRKELEIILNGDKNESKS